MVKAITITSSRAPELQQRQSQPLRSGSREGARRKRRKRSLSSSSAGRAAPPSWQQQSRAERAARREALRDVYFDNLNDNAQQRRRSKKKRRHTRSRRAQAPLCEELHQSHQAVEATVVELPLVTTPSAHGDSSSGSAASPQRPLCQAEEEHHVTSELSPSQSNASPASSDAESCHAASLSPPRALTRAERAQRRCALRDKYWQGERAKEKQKRRQRCPAAASSESHQGVLSPLSLAGSRQRQEQPQQQRHALSRLAPQRLRSEKDVTRQAADEDDDSDVSLQTADIASTVSDDSDDSDFQCNVGEADSQQEEISGIAGADSFQNFPHQLCVQILECLTQSEIFRAASSCKPLRGAAQTSHLFSCLDLQRVGYFTTKAGRKTRILDAVSPFLLKMLEQRRFKHITELDLSDQYLGRSEHILSQAAETCPDIRILKLGRVKPEVDWSDLGRYLPKSLERKFRKWWKARPLTIEAWGRTYFILDED